MDAASAIVVVIDGLGARYLGPYGATWIETPAFNRLASQSLLAEQAYADSPDLDVAYTSYWTGRHAAAHGVTPSLWLPQRLAQRDLPTTLLTDDPRLAEHPGANTFAERIIVAEAAFKESSESDDDIAATQMARLFAQAIDLLERARGPFFLWIHSRGMSGPWDAPPSFREQFRDEEDPPAMNGASPPAGNSPAGYDPDELLPLAGAYAAQVTVLDQCLASFLEAVEAVEAKWPLLHILTSPRGCPLGEHNVIGMENAGLYEELLHTPLFVRFPERVGAAQRTEAPIQPADVQATILSALGDVGDQGGGANILPLATNERAPWRSHALSLHASAREHSVRTRCWSLRRVVAIDETPADEPRIELFFKPDDRCDANEIASRRPLAAAGMIALLDESLSAAKEVRPIDESVVPKEIFEPE